ncbi:MAG: hypothetical protein AB1638_12175 [Nitrospirota bacterium]
MKVKSMRDENLIKIARVLKNEFEAISPFVERHTSTVCPLCETVCCINKHGHYEKEDLIFLSALGIDVPAGHVERNDSDPCRFLTERGCSLERWMRPFRCTWFFCGPLLNSMDEDKQEYRKFIKSLQGLISIRQKLTE